MRTFNISFLMVLSCVAMIGATSIGNRADHSPDTLPEVADSAEQVAGYVALQQLMEVLT